MGGVLGIGVVESIEAIAAGLLEESSAAAVAEAVSEAVAEGESAIAAAGESSSLSASENEAASVAAQEVINSGGTVQQAVDAAIKAVSKEISNIEITDIGETISGISGIPGGGIAGSAISSATGITSLGDISGFFSDLIASGEISEEVGIELSQLPAVTDSAIAETGLSRTAFEAFEIEGSEMFKELDSETKTLFSKLKTLGKNVTDLIKKSILDCIKTKVKFALCVAATTETIRGLHNKFFAGHGGDNPNVTPDFSTVEPYLLGKTVGELTAGGINNYFDEITNNPNLAKDETAVDNLILRGFRNLTSSLHNSLSRQVYKMIRTSRFIKNKEVQNKFDEIFKTYTGKFQSFPFRDPQTKLITYVDETGKSFSYKGVTNLSSKTTLLGYWLGPLSYNDSYPLWEGREPEAGKVPRYSGSGLLDSYACAHDIDYTDGGYFNMVGDFKLISRILHNTKSMTYKEQAFANVTVAWFSTLGTILNSYLHPLVVNFDARDPTKTFTSDEANDLYRLLVPLKPKKLNGIRVKMSGQNEQDTQDEDNRKKFYKGLRDSLRTEYAGFALNNGSGDQENQTSNLLQFFDNLEVFDC